MVPNDVSDSARGMSHILETCKSRYQAHPPDHLEML